MTNSHIDLPQGAIVYTDYDGIEDEKAYLHPGSWTRNLIGIYKIVAETERKVFCERIKNHAERLWFWKSENPEWRSWVIKTK